MNLKLPYNRELEVINIKYLYNDNIKYLISLLGNLQDLLYITFTTFVLLFETLQLLPATFQVMTFLTPPPPFHDCYFNWLDWSWCQTLV